MHTVTGLFDTYAALSPTAPAVLHGDRQWSYAQLEQHANRLAHHLRELGVQPESRVGICLERGLDMLIGLFAILKVALLSGL